MLGVALVRSYSLHGCCCISISLMLVKFYNLRESHPHLMQQPLQLWTQEFDISLECINKCLALLWFQGIPSMDAVVSSFPPFDGEIFTFEVILPPSHGTTNAGMVSEV